MGQMRVETMGKTCYLSDSERRLVCGLLKGESLTDLMSNMNDLYDDVRDFGEISLAIIRKLED